MIKPTPPQGRLIRRKELEDRIGLARSTIYRMMAEETFPRPVRIGRRAVAWPESEIEHWIAARPAADPTEPRVSRPSGVR